MQALAAALVAVPGCHWPRGSQSLDSWSVIRAEDQLALTLKFSNLELIERHAALPLLRRIDTALPARVAVHLPGQNIAERVYDRLPDDPPRSAGPIAGPTIIAFQWPEDVVSIPLDIETLLDWDAWLPEAESSIELPAGLALTPQHDGRWRHAKQPVTYNGRTELWHTRWRPTGHDRRFQIGPPAATLPPMRNGDSALDDEDRAALMRNGTADVDTLLLSPLGGWLTISGRWEQDPNADIARWEHVIAAGQDQRVVVQRRDGFLYPFGQRAALLEVTEREIVSGVALLRRRRFITIREAQRAFTPGRITFSALRITEATTPALAADTPTQGPFWVTLESGEVHRFPMQATDWDDQSVNLSAAAVFCPDDAIAAGASLYADDAHASQRLADLSGESVVVAPFDGASTDGWGSPLEHPREAADTEVTLLQVEFAGDPTVSGDRPFDCLTPQFFARVPSLAAFLPERRNQGWFHYENPDSRDNKPELFALANTDRAPPIPLAFGSQADRCGGLVTPSYDVDGLSRTLGPISNADLLKNNTPYSFADYFSADAMLLGVLPLRDVLRPLQFDGALAPNLPQLALSLQYKQPKEADKDIAHWIADATLSWSLDLPNARVSLLRFERRDDEKPAKLKLSATLSKRLTRQPVPPEDNESTDEKDTEPTSDADTTQKNNGDDKKNGIGWEAAAKLTDFDLILDAGDAASLAVGFKELGLKLGPAKKKKKETAQESEAADTDKPAENDNDDKEWPVSVSKVVKLAEIRGSGALAFINPLMNFAAHLPNPPNFDLGEAAPAFPASLPGVGDADVSVTIGPIEAPTFQWLQFEVSQLNANFGMGLYFFPRDGDKRAKDPLFTLRIASADKPVLLVAEPWGGSAFIAVNFTTRQLTAFQCGIGLIYRVSLKFAIGVARCEGSLTLVYTYLKPDNDPASNEIGGVIRLQGIAVIGGWINVTLALVAVGIWDDSSGWTFAGEVTLRVQIAFFAATARVGFTYNTGGGKQADRLGNAVCDESAPLQREAWQRYRAAFASSSA
ncbi:MAG: hypothetical protein AAF290_15215 [Pseudomonadota bacterium]